MRERRKKLISQKKKITEKTVVLEYPLVTTLSSWQSRRLIKFYKKRQTIEDIFKDFNQSFNAQSLPSRSFWGNALYFTMVSLVANSSFFFRKEILKLPYQTTTTETIRDKFINHAGEITTLLQGVQIELSQKIQNKAEITALLQKQQELLPDRSS